MLIQAYVYMAAYILISKNIYGFIYNLPYENIDLFRIWIFFLVKFDHYVSWREYWFLKIPSNMEINKFNFLVIKCSTFLNHRV